MALLFTDSFDHYIDLGQKYTEVPIGCGSIVATPGLARTGPQCYEGGPIGPAVSFTARDTWIAGAGAKYVTGVSAGNFIIFLAGGTTGNKCGSLRVNSDGSVFVQIGPDPANLYYGPSAPGVVQSNNWNYLEVKIKFATSGGHITVNVNGFQVLHYTGINTDPFGYGSPNTVQLSGPGSGLSVAIDDYYICDTSGGVNDDFLGPVRVYSGPPVSDSTPLQWITSAGATHFNLVSSIPPNPATYVTDATVGDVDQYIHSVSAVPVTSTIKAVQHVLNAQVDTVGVRKVSSVCANGTGMAGMALTTTYHMLWAPYDINPVSGNPWDISDFATVPFGPKVEV